MSTLSIASYLRDFGAPDGSAGHRAAVPSRAKEIEDAYARGMECGRTRAEAAAQARIEEQRREFDSAIAIERQERSADVARLAAAFTAGLESMEQAIAEAVGRVLRPFLDARIEEQALAELREALAELMAKDSGLALTVSGPEHLLASLSQHMPETAGTITYIPAGGCEVRVMAGNTILETRLRAWRGGLEEAMR